MSDKICHNEQMTASIAKDIGQELADKDNYVVAITGDLGVGKTFFCKYFINYLTNIPIDDIISPTFNILQIYEYENRSIYHYDLYRINNIAELYEMDFEDNLYHGINLIEWPEIAVDLLPSKNIFHLNMKFDLDNNTRLITFK
ncbi:MAG: tRNA (adenosine(37)-N6)-threonylcarbamoyltransferase complex ATPase subunit type 1 TsaE [Pseudomonadota bacterium]